MGKRKGYNGHESWNAWNVSLWLSSDEGTYRAMLDCIRRTHNREEAAALMLEMLPANTPDGAPYTKRSVRLAMAGF
jgi:hypothetical protein